MSAKYDDVVRAVKEAGAKGVFGISELMLMLPKMSRAEIRSQMRLIMGLKSRPLTSVAWGTYSLTGNSFAKQMGGSRKKPPKVHMKENGSRFYSNDELKKMALRRGMSEEEYEESKSRRLVKSRRDDLGSYYGQNITR